MRLKARYVHRNRGLVSSHPYKPPDHLLASSGNLRSSHLELPSKEEEKKWKITM
jgi:hypothetical protein